MEIFSFRAGRFRHFIRFEMDSLWQGRFAYGAEINMEKVSSGGHKFDALGLHTLDLTQGPLAANTKYNRYAFYMETLMKSFWLDN